MGGPPAPVLVFDGDCGFCTSSVRVIERWVRPRCLSVPWQRADLAALGVSGDRARREALWVTPEGTVHGGAEAVARILRSAGGGWALCGAAMARPPLSWVARAAYRVVAANRRRLPGGTPACALPPPLPPADGPQR
ncbi:thiol-disulfide oxidoreductase DCC family protein [Streptomyces sp. NPDC002640]